MHSIKDDTEIYDWPQQTRLMQNIHGFWKRQLP